MWHSCDIQHSLWHWHWGTWYWYWHLTTQGSGTRTQGTGTGIQGTGTGLLVHLVFLHKVLRCKVLVLDFWSTLYPCTRFWYRDARHWYWTSGPPCISAQGSGTRTQGAIVGMKACDIEGSFYCSLWW